jgi:hypothetical protein
MIDPNKFYYGSEKKELTELTNGTQFIITGTHGTIITKMK